MLKLLSSIVELNYVQDFLIPSQYVAGAAAATAGAATGAAIPAAGDATAAAGAESVEFIHQCFLKCLGIVSSLNIGFTLFFLNLFA